LISELPQVPPANKQAFERLYAVEVTLREFTRKTLSETFGRQWRKRCIPHDVKEKMRRGIEQERTRAWHHVIPHDSLYYCDFADIKKIIVKKDNWEGAFKKYLHDETVFEGLLQQLEPIRNRTAHNRLVSENDVEAVTAALALLCDKLGLHAVAGLLEEAGRTCDMRAMLRGVSCELSAIHAACLEPERPLPATTAYDALETSGFFDIEFLGPMVAPIEEAYKTAERVALFPRRPGTGHQLEALIRELGVTELLSEAQRAIDAQMNGF
jgi:hypothetical protein